MKRPKIKSVMSVLYVLIFIVLTFLFFTNDFGLLDLRKTSVVIGVGLDVEGEEVTLTAQLAVPQPAENGENTKFNVVTGTGASVAAALNEVNVKTGFYPKLVFCKLILLGESCFKEDVSKLLDYFYRNEYTGLAQNIAACEGSAAELIAQQFPCGSSATDVLDRLLSTPAMASGNVAAITIKDFGTKLYSLSESAYMPYIQNGVLEETESGGGDSGSGGESGGGSGGGGQQCEESELVCNRCAIFAGGYCKGILSKEETFVFNLINNDVRHAFLVSGEGEDKRVLGLRNCKGGTSLKIENGNPVLQFEFKAAAKVQDSESGFDPQEAKEERVDENALRAGEKTIADDFASLFESVRLAGCDVLGLKGMLYKSYADQYEQYAPNLMNTLTVTCKVNLRSSS